MDKTPMSTEISKQIKRKKSKVGKAKKCGKKRNC